MAPFEKQVVIGCHGRGARMHHFKCFFSLTIINFFLIPYVFAESADSGSRTPQKMLLSIQETGALQDIDPRRLKTIAGLVTDALIKAGYEVQDTEAVNGMKQVLRDLQRDNISDNRGLAGFSHLLEVSIETEQKKQSPVGFSLNIGDSDPRSPESQKVLVTPIHCTLMQLNAFREEGRLVQDRQVSRSEGWSDVQERAYARNIYSVCRALLAEIEFPLAHSKDLEAEPGVRVETTYADDRPKAAAAAPVVKAKDDAAKSELASTAPPVEQPTATPAKAPAAQPPSAVKIDRSSKRKQIIIYNPGDTLILEIGNNRR